MGRCDAVDGGKSAELGADALQLEAIIADLRSVLTSRDAQLSEQCQLAAEEEGKVVERRLGIELSDARAQGERLQETMAAQSETLSTHSEQLSHAEHRLAEAEQREQRQREREDRRKARQARLKQLDGDHRTNVEKLQSDLRRRRERSEETATHLRRALAKENLECSRLAERNQAAEENEAVADLLRTKVAACHQKVVDLEASTEDMQSIIANEEAEVDKLILLSADLEEEAKAKDEDVGLQSELASSEEKVSDITKKTAQLRHMDFIAGNLGMQLRSSSHLVSDMETALLHLQAEVDSAELPEEPPETWPHDRDRLRAQLIAMHQAEKEATEHFAALEAEAKLLQNTRDCLQPSGITESPTDKPVHMNEYGAQTCMREENVKAETHQNRLQATNVRIIELDAALVRVRSALDAKGRRLQLLASRRRSSTGMNRDTKAAGDCLRERVAVADRRVIDLEALVSELDTQLNNSDREVQQLKRHKESKERADQERDLLHTQLVRAQEQRIERLLAALQEGVDRKNGIRPGAPNRNTVDLGEEGCQEPADSTVCRRTNSRDRGAGSHRSRRSARDRPQ